MRKGLDVQSGVVVWVVVKRKQELVMTNWINWNGGECPIVSDRTRVEYKMLNASVDDFWGKRLRWDWQHGGTCGDIIAYRIIEDHEPKMTREQITAQIEALQKQLDALHDETRPLFWIGVTWSDYESPCRRTHEELATVINGVPHIHGVAMKEMEK
jgi:hypothetical protein